jgi:hypothetical protein
MYACRRAGRLYDVSAVYLELADKRTLSLGFASMKGSLTIVQTVDLGKLP